MLRRVSTLSEEIINIPLQAATFIGSNTDLKSLVATLDFPIPWPLDLARSTLDITSVNQTSKM